MLHDRADARYHEPDQIFLPVHPGSLERVEELPACSRIGDAELLGDVLQASAGSERNNETSLGLGETERLPDEVDRRHSLLVGIAHEDNDRCSIRDVAEKSASKPRDEEPERSLPRGARDAKRRRLVAVGRLHPCDRRGKLASRSGALRSESGVLHQQTIAAIEDRTGLEVCGDDLALTIEQDDSRPKPVEHLVSAVSRVRDASNLAVEVEGSGEVRHDDSEEPKLLIPERWRLPRPNEADHRHPFGLFDGNSSHDVEEVSGPEEVVEKLASDKLAIEEDPVADEGSAGRCLLDFGAPRITGEVVGVVDAPRLFVVLTRGDPERTGVTFLAGQVEGRGYAAHPSGKAAQEDTPAIAGSHGLVDLTDQIGQVKIARVRRMRAPPG